MTTTSLVMSEKQWQQRIVEFAEWHHWRCFHPYDSRRSTAGWPDLAFVRRGRLVLAELKTDTGKVSPAQREWLGDLSAVVGIEVFVWRPSDWPTVQAVLGAESDIDLFRGAAKMTAQARIATFGRST